MDPSQFISKARVHVGKIWADAQLSAEDFPRVQVRETVMVCFWSDARKDRVVVFLDQATGDFVTIMYEGTGTRISKTTPLP